MLPVLLSLAASSCWGVADFLGGLQSKRVPVAIVLCVVEGTGLVGVLVIIAATGEPFPGPRAAVLAMVAGVGRRHRPGLLLPGAGDRDDEHRGADQRHRRRAAGRGRHRHRRPAVDHRRRRAGGHRRSASCSPRASSHDDAERAAAGRLSVGLALVAAVGFGSYFVLSDAAADDSVLWLLVLSRIIPVPALAAFAWARGMRPPPARTASILVAAGTLDCGATALYGVANTKGALSIVSVVGSLYPVMTLILARAVLGERIRPVQQAGVAAALAGVAMIAAG